MSKKTANETTTELTVKTESSIYDPSNDPELAELLTQAVERELSTVNTYNLLPQIQLQHQSIKPKFTLGGEVEVETIVGYILNDTTTKENYDEGTPIPVCYSVGGVNGTVYGSCGKCKHYAWGSGKDGSGRKCKEYRKTLLWLEESNTTYELKIPVTSLRAFDQFKATTLFSTKKPLCMSRIKLTLIPHSEGTRKWAEIKFERLGDISEQPKPIFASCMENFKKFSKFYTPTLAHPGAESLSEEVTANAVDIDKVAAATAQANKPKVGKTFAEKDETETGEVPF